MPFLNPQRLCQPAASDSRDGDAPRRIRHIPRSPAAGRVEVGKEPRRTYFPARLADGQDLKLRRATRGRPLPPAACGSHPRTFPLSCFFPFGLHPRLIQKPGLLSHLFSLMESILQASCMPVCVIRSKTIVRLSFLTRSFSSALDKLTLRYELGYRN